MRIDREFHISRSARDLYRFDKRLFALSGNVVLADFHAARVFAQRMNSRRDLASFPERAVRAGQINAMGLIDEILHYVAELFREQKNREVLAQALQFLERRLGRKDLDATLLRFLDEFPPVEVYQGSREARAWLAGRTEGTPNRQVALEELLILWLANENPAFSPYLELFDDSGLERSTAYRALIGSLREFFGSQPCFGPGNQNLVEMLRSPAEAQPHSLTGQLEYIRHHWGYLLGRYLFRLLGSLDLIREEQRLAFAGPGPARVYEYRGQELELEAFSADRDWMPKVVMIAKNAYVWLDQLSRRHGRRLSHLDEVPDEELDRLARWGFTALWLIGLWERSRASRRIKQMCGNPEAEASAYSLMGYEIAGDLGGWEAFQNLKGRAWRRGIRMAGDMVPNHMGIDSHWVMEHPDWFVSLPYSPFPSYTFGGADLSWDGRVGLYLEDHYYTRSDAAVVFRRVQRESGEERFIYHGNDGTSMPWNDTAQLDFLKPEVREAVIQTILHVAHNFPVIRFDAAMTLTKKHYQRLWFPEPGTGGDIPSRAGQGVSRARLDELMPKEFWREVVDRVAQEAPDTLLLAEAFWLLEGYFVRTLGMHRVYNSAFMNMLKNEDNAQYRLVIKNTLEFNPEVLKRFVNFMNNPDEETAVAQFGREDKYFGVCTMMVTLPGLPMFGHGQVEGFTEKYGMEYRRAYWDENPDEHLIWRHEQKIFPLLHRRTLFAEVEHFLLYDFYNPGGTVNEDVFAYSNRSGGERALVIYHNRYAEARGWVHESAAYSVRTGRGEERTLVRRTLGQGLGLGGGQELFSIFRDHVSGLEYIRSNRDLHDRGLYVELGAYKLHVFLDFREVADDAWHPYRHLADYLDGRGVPSVEEALREIVLQPVHVPFKEVVNARSCSALLEALEKGTGTSGSLLEELSPRLDGLAEKVAGLGGGGRAAGREALAGELRRKLGACLKLPGLLEALPSGAGKRWLSALQQREADMRAALVAWLFVHPIGLVGGRDGFEQRSRSWVDEWLLGKLLSSCLQDAGVEQRRAQHVLALADVLTVHQRWFEGDGALPEAGPLVESLLSDSEVLTFLGVNRYQGKLWFHAESFEELVTGLALVAALDALAQAEGEERRARKALAPRLSVCRTLLRAAELSAYQVEKLLAAARGAAP
jgi:glycosidase